MSTNMTVIVKSETVTKRGHNQIMRRVHKHMGLTWKREYLPRHFEHGAKNRYKYAPLRSSIHVNQAVKHGLNESTAKSLLVEAKKRGKGKGNRIAYWRMKQALGKPPKVLSGRLRLHARTAGIAANKTRGSVQFPSYFPLRKEFREEIELVTKLEQRDIFKRSHGLYQTLATRPQFQTKAAQKIS